MLRLESTGRRHGATVVGTLPSAYPGEELHVFGKWATHPSHGRQFKSEYAERSLPRTKEAIYAYLAGRAVKGIGPATAALIVDRFGDRTLDVLEQLARDASRRYAASPPPRPRPISRDFRRQAGLRRLMEFLCAHELKPLLAVRLYRFYGEDAMDAVSADPYIIASPHIGGSFAEADRLAFDLGGEAATSPRACAPRPYSSSGTTPATGTASSPRTSSPPPRPSSSAWTRRRRSPRLRPSRRRRRRARGARRARRLLPRGALRGRDARRRAPARHGRRQPSRRRRGRHPRALEARSGVKYAP